MILNKNADIAFNEMVELDYGSNFYSYNHNNHYMYESAYMSYLESKIDNEKAIVSTLKDYIPVSESMVILEAKFSDNVKAKFNKLVEFIKGLISKFMESMSAFFLDNKEYLEKYKDIILKKKPKEELEYSYTGDYAVAINRLINTPLPIFNYRDYAAVLNEEGNNAVIQKIIQSSGASDKNINLDNDEKLSEIFKEYFTAADKGQSEGNFSQLNMTDLYNFCYNYKDIEKIITKDRTTLEQTTNAVVQALDNEIKNPTATPSTPGAATGNNAGAGNATSNTDNAAKNESALLEADGDNNQQPNTNQNPNQNSTGNGGSTADNKEDKPKGTNSMKITGTNAAKQMGSYDQNANTTNAANAAKGQGVDIEGKDATEKSNQLMKVADKWKTVCSSLLTAKLTAYEQISKDYMAIIREHVRSYGGKDLKDKSTDKAKQTGTQYNKAENEGEQQGEQK